MSEIVPESLVLFVDCREKVLLGVRTVGFAQSGGQLGMILDAVRLEFAKQLGDRFGMLSGRVDLLGRVGGLEGLFDESPALDGPDIGIRFEQSFVGRLSEPREFGDG
jgi:hypothetical protein